MESKSASPSPSPIQQPQPIGQAVVFKNEAATGKSLSLPSSSIKTILAGFVMLFLVGGVGVGVYLVEKQQQLSSKASNDSAIPQNIKSIVPAKDINPAATKSAQASSSASQSASLSAIVIPELDSSSSGNLDASSLADELANYDFNQDGAANSVDLSVMYAGWGIPKNDLQTKADLNQDGTINGIDYSLFLQHFNQKV